MLDTLKPCPFLNQQTGECSGPVGPYGQDPSEMSRVGTCLANTDPVPLRALRRQAACSGRDDNDSGDIEPMPPIPYK